jgi:hypothetical protein
MALLGLLATRPLPTLHAQSTPADTPYWRYSAARRLTHVIPADMNGDGVSELLLAAENGRVDLLNAHNALLEWSYTATAPVVALHPINPDTPDHPLLETALVTTDNQLILLNAQGEEVWRVSLAFTAANELLPLARQLVPYDMNGDGRDELLILFNNGILHLYDQDGNLLRRLDEHITVAGDVGPHMKVGDVNGDGRDEILLGLFNPEKRFSELFLLDASGQSLWEDAPAISGHITAVALVPFGVNGALHIAVGTDWGQLHLYDANRQRPWWPRTLNRPITALAVAHFPEGPALLAGTDVSMVVAYAADGHRFWTRRLTTDASRPVLGLTAVPYTPDVRNPILAVNLGPHATTGGDQQVKLLDASGLEAGTFTAGEGRAPLSFLLDINGDQHSELVLTRFATVELQGLGLGAAEMARAWDYLLDADPGAILVVDFDKDGRDELLLGAQNGKLHYLVDGNVLEWLHAPGGAITQLAYLERTSFAEPVPTIVVGRNNTTADPDNPDEIKSWVELRHTNGERIWEIQLDAPLTDMLVENVNDTGDPEIIVSTANGDIIFISATGAITWRTELAETEEDGRLIRHLLLTDNPQGEPMVLAATANHIYAAAVGSNIQADVASFPDAPVRSLFNLNQPGVELANRLLVLADAAYGLNWRGILLPPWPRLLNGRPLAAIPANDPVQEAFTPTTVESFLIATDNNELQRLSVQDNKPEMIWTLTGLNDLTAMYWGDLDGNRLAEFAVGDADGRVRLFSNIPPKPQYLGELNLTSGVFALTALRRGQENRSDLLVVTENGEVQLFNTQENHPPLLTNPTTEVNPGQYGFSISVMDAENDSVRLRLDIQEPETGEWVASREAVLSNGNGPMVWNLVNPLASADGVHYRIYYNDDSHAGYIYPPTGPLPLAPLLPPTNSTAISLLAAVLGGIVLLVGVRQIQSPAMRTRRFYWRLKHWPAETLVRLENRYVSTHGSPDFLLALSGLARQRNDELVSGLADGLFLLADRPQAGLPLISGALAKAAQLEPRWQALERWQLLFQSGGGLLTAPTLTELSLKWPQLHQLLQSLAGWDYWSPALHALLPALTTIRDGERVERPDDRLVYLHEAAQQLAAVRQDLHDYDEALEKPLALALAERWGGLVTAAMEELEGRAELVIRLKTRRIVPHTASQITFEITNYGRAAAENIMAVLKDDPAYAYTGLPETIPFLPPGQTHPVAFDIRPEVIDRFRVELTVSFDDRHQSDRHVAFGDRVSVLTPPHEFTPIPNPYRPGTPLRQNSTVFYGRAWLFDFIAENAGGWSQRNVLILIGQRRTGKTSALLNLEQHLPPHLVPVYIDCQSLGVVPGMAALFHDLAWLIADALAARDLELAVPPMNAWEIDPAGLLQRHFLPTARKLLPPESTLLLVFDEFEVFEHLVDDGILPPTFFNFLRHLMQHSDGLSFVFVGTRRLEEMSADYWSVLFNIALYQRITYLREESATRLITEPVAPHLVYDDLALDKILRVTAGHPYFLQLVCYTLVQQANNQRKGYVTISDVNAALDEMLTLGEVHFAFLWQRSSFTERAILTAVAHMPERPSPFRPQEFVQFLEPYGIHLQPAEVTAALNTLVAREIMREVREGATVQYELRLGLVGLWVARQKSLSKLHTQDAPQPAPTNGAAQNGQQRVKQIKG